MPLSAPVDGSNVTPPGNAPLSLSVEAEKPEDFSVNSPEFPAVNIARFGLEIAASSFTVSVKFYVAADPIPFAAPNVTECAPPLPAAGVPSTVPVPFPTFIKPSPPGSAPVSEVVAGGAPVVVTPKLPATPT